MVLAGALAAAPAVGAPGNGNSGNTPADTIHPNIHDKVGQGDGTNANPKDKRNGGQIHGIGNTPGQDGDAPQQKFSEQLDDVHGGIDEWNPNHPSAD